MCVCMPQPLPSLSPTSGCVGHSPVCAVLLNWLLLNWLLPRLLQVYPTMAELAGLPKPPINCPGCLEGDSAAPLLDRPHMTWKKGAFSQYARCRNAATASTGYYQRCSGQELDTITAMGYSVRTQDWRYTEWFPFNDTTLLADMGPGTTIARELYDHVADVGDDMDWPGAGSDLLNVAEEPANAATVKALATMVREGWKAQRPQ